MLIHLYLYSGQKKRVILLRQVIFFIDEAGREIEENQEIGIHSVLKKRMTKRTKIVNAIATEIGTATAVGSGNGIGTVAIAIMTGLIGTRTGIVRTDPTGPIEATEATEATGATVATG